MFKRYSLRSIFVSLLLILAVPAFAADFAQSIDEIDFRPGSTCDFFFFNTAVFTVSGGPWIFDSKLIVLSGKTKFPEISAFYMVDEHMLIEKFNEVLNKHCPGQKLLMSQIE